MMKLGRDEFKRSEEQPVLALFAQGIKSPMTLEKYTRTLRLILCKVFEEILDGAFEERAEQLVRLAREDPEWARDLLLNLSRKLRERTKLPPDHPDYYNPISFSSYFKPIKKLFEMNGVLLDWKRVYATAPEEDNPTESREWRREEIQKMLRFAGGAMDRAMLLVIASSGIRAGGFGELAWKDLLPVYIAEDGTLYAGNDGVPEGAKLACATLKIYRKSNESYPAFITPEAHAALMEYRTECADRLGREPRPDDSIFLKSGPIPRPATQNTICRHIGRIANRAGLRDPSTKVSSRRHEAPLMNGFRRFWNKTCKEAAAKDSTLSTLIKLEYMMGHHGLVKLDRNYFKTHLIELAQAYINVVPDLTISDAERLRETNRLQNDKIRSLEDEKDSRIADLEKLVKQLSKRLDA